MTRKRSRVGLGMVSGAVLALALTVPGQAQEGGRRLSFGISERLEATRNPGLTSPSDGTRYRADTRVDMTLSSITRTQSLTFSADAALRAASGPGITDTYELTRPNVSASYERLGPGSSFTLSARLRSEDIAFLRPLEDFIDDDGVLVLPEDFQDLYGSGTRRTYGATTGLRFGEDGPLGMGVRAGATVTDYVDAGPALFDHKRYWATLDTRARLAPGRDLTTTLRYSRSESDDPTVATNDVIGADTRLVFARRDGQVSIGGGIEDSINGTRASASAGWQRQLPDGSLGLTLGATRTISGSLALTGSANLSRTYAFGTVGANVRRSVGEDSSNAERIATGATVNFSRSLTKTTGLSLGADLAQTTSTMTDLSVTNVSLRTSINHQLSPDWNMNLGYSHYWRNDENSSAGWVGSDVVFFGISRRFDTGF